MEHPIHLSAFVAIVIGASLSEPHTSVSSLHTRVCMFACLLAWTNHLSWIKWVRSNISWRSTSSSWSMWRSDCQSAASATGATTSWKLNVLVHLVGSNAGLLPECSVGNHSGDGSSLSKHGTLLLVCHSTYGPTINGRPLADHTKLYMPGWGKGRCINDTHKR